jgi:hypothetical protein
MTDAEAIEITVKTTNICSAPGETAETHRVVLSVTEDERQALLTRRQLGHNGTGGRQRMKTKIPEATNVTLRTSAMSGVLMSPGRHESLAGVPRHHRRRQNRVQPTGLPWVRNPALDPAGQPTPRSHGDAGEVRCWSRWCGRVARKQARRVCGRWGRTRAAAEPGWRLRACRDRRPAHLAPSERPTRGALISGYSACCGDPIIDVTSDNRGEFDHPGYAVPVVRPSLACR